MFRTYASQYAAKPNKSENKHERCKHLSDRLNLITKAGSFSYGFCIISTVEVLSNHFKYFAAYFHVLPGISQARNNKMNLFLSTVDSEARIKLRVATINYKLHELEYTPTTLPANSIYGNYIYCFRGVSSAKHVHIICTNWCFTVQIWMRFVS